MQLHRSALGLQLTVDEAHSAREADVGVVEVAETAERDDRQRQHQVLEDRVCGAVNVVLRDTREAPVDV